MGLFVNATVFLRPFSGQFFPTDMLVGSFMALSFVKDELRKINSQTQSGGPARRSSCSQPLRSILQRWVGEKENNVSSCIFLSLNFSSRGKEKKNKKRKINRKRESWYFWRPPVQEADTKHFLSSAAKSLPPPRAAQERSR